MGAWARICGAPEWDDTGFTGPGDCDTNVDRRSASVISGVGSTTVPGTSADFCVPSGGGAGAFEVCGSDRMTNACTKFVMPLRQTRISGGSFPVAMAPRSSSALMSRNTPLPSTQHHVKGLPTASGYSSLRCCGQQLEVSVGYSLPAATQSRTDVSGSGRLRCEIHPAGVGKRVQLRLKGLH